MLSSPFPSLRTARKIAFARKANIFTPGQWSMRSKHGDAVGHE